MNLKKNVGTHDAHIRIVFGVFFLLFAIFLVENPTAKILLAVASAILAGTASLRFCFLYTLLHKNTCEEKYAEKPLDGPTPTTNSSGENASDGVAPESMEERSQ